MALTRPKALLRRSAFAIYEGLTMVRRRIVLGLMIRVRTILCHF